MRRWQRQAVSFENWVPVGWGGLFASGFLGSHGQATALVAWGGIRVAWGRTSLFLCFMPVPLRWDGKVGWGQMPQVDIS